MAALHKKKNGEILYAICYEEPARNGSIETGIAYVHARDRGHVAMLLMSHKNSDMFRKGTRIVDIAPAVGAFETEKGLII